MRVSPTPELTQDRGLPSTELQARIPPQGLSRGSSGMGPWTTKLRQVAEVAGLISRPCPGCGHRVLTNGRIIGQAGEEEAAGGSTPGY